MTDDYSDWTDEQRMAGYNACRRGVNASNNKPGEAAVIALMQGDIPSYIASWIGMILHEYDDAGECYRFLTPQQKAAVIKARAEDRANRKLDPANPLEPKAGNKI